MENFVLYDEIGSGDRRVVYKGRRRGTISYVAIHCVDKSRRWHLQNHVRFCHELNHDNVVGFYEWYETSNHLWMVVELCVGDSLRQILAQDSFLPEATVRSFGHDLVRGLCFLHRNDIVYADLQPSKVLLAGNGKLKFSNFCLARMLGESVVCDPSGASESSESDKDRLQGAPAYIAPEVLQGGHYTRESDLWSLGCLLHEMFTGAPPFVAASPPHLVELICNSEIRYPVQGKDGTIVKASESLYMLIQGLLQKDPVHRIDWLELCMHPFWEGELGDLADELEGSNDRDTTSVISLDEGTNAQATRLSLLGRKGNRPETVPVAVRGLGLKTHSLDMSQQKPAPTDAVPKSDSKNSKPKPAWEGTYKVEKGFAIIDLTELSENDLTRKDSSKEVRTSYAKSREVKTPIPHSPTQLNLEDSFNSASTFGDVIPRIGPDLNIIDHLYHPSDLVVSPIADNPRILKLPVLKWDSQFVPSALLTLEKISQTTKEELASLVTGLLTALQQLGKTAQGSNGLRQKMHIIAYLAFAAKFDQVSNLLLGHDLWKILLMELKTSSSSDLKMRIAHLLSVVSSSATYIAPSFNMTEVFQVVTDQLKQNSRIVRFKQTLLPVLGEFLFFAATQEESEQRVISGWEPSGSAFTFIARCLHQGEDNIVQHIAAKIIENVTTTTGRHCKKFLTNEVGLGLWNLYVHASADAEKVTAASALSRISMHQPNVLQHVAERAGMVAFTDALFSGTQRTQQAFTTICVSLLSTSMQAKKIFQDASFIQKIVHNLESSSLILRGKLYLLIAEVSTRHQDVLLLCCQARLIGYIERDSRKLTGGGKGDSDNLKYVQQCLTVVVNNIVNVLPVIFDGISHILSLVAGRHHPNPAQAKQLRQHLPLLSIVLHLITSPMFRKRIVEESFLQFIGVLLERIKSIDSGEINLSGAPTQDLSENIISDVFSIIEAITQHPPILMEHFECVVLNILPKLAGFAASDDGNLRILSFKLFSDMATLYLDSETLDESHRKDERTKAINLLHQVITDSFIPNFQALLSDQDPLPAYCVKLLHACAEKNPAIVQVLVEKNVVGTLLSMLQTHQRDISGTILMNIVGILNCMLSDKRVSFFAICQQGLVEYLTASFIEVATVIDEDEASSSVSPLLLQLLDTLHLVMKNIDLAVKSVADKGNDQIIQINQQEVDVLLSESKVLAELNGILINLLVFDDSDIQEWACRCLYLSAELFGGEYEDCFEDDNLQYLFEALKSGSRKRQKVVLRIIRRFITCSGKIKSMFARSWSDLETILGDLTKLGEADADCGSVKSLAVEITKLF